MRPCGVSTHGPTPTEAELCVHLAGGTADELRKLRRNLGSGRPWLRLSRDAWAKARLPPGRIARLAEVRDGRAARHELERCRQHGIRLVAHSHPDFPAGLRTLPRPPVLLCVRGRWPTPERALAVVGSRAATPYGRQATRRLAGAAARDGFAVVSGLARGIDRHALVATMDEGGWPIAVLGCGIDVAYPPEHRALQESIATEGTLISEFPLGTRPTRFTFPRRNRIIAALAQAVLVVEAGRRSGALITAGFALDLDREVLAVPGPIDSVQSQGTNRLILDGAHPVIDVPALLLPLGGSGGGAARTAEPVHPLVAALGGRALAVDELARTAGMDVRATRSALIALELSGEVRRVDGGRYIAREARGARS
jgi:DNA processing protein